MLTKYPGPISVIVFVALVIVLWLADYLLKWSKPDTLALQQLIIAVIGIPATIYGLLTAAAAFQKTQTRPELELLWEVKPNVFDKTLIITHNTVNGTTGNQGKVVLRNI